MTQNNTPLAGIYTAPSCKVINIELEGAILAVSGNTEELGNSYDFDWNGSNN